MTTERIKVYIAGPYTKPDPAVNVANACRCWRELWDLGFVPFCPHWTHLQHMLHPLPYEAWMEYDRAWLVSCDVLLRLPGESAGADREVDDMGRLGKPVVHSVDELLTLTGGAK